MIQGTLVKGSTMNQDTALSRKGNVITIDLDKMQETGESAFLVSNPDMLEEADLDASHATINLSGCLQMGPKDQQKSKDDKAIVGQYNLISTKGRFGVEVGNQARFQCYLKNKKHTQYAESQTVSNKKGW